MSAPQLCRSTASRLLLLLLLLGVGQLPAVHGRQRTVGNHRPREKSTVTNLCSKDVDMKLACHCSLDDTARRTVTEADCLVLHEDFPQSDAAWLSFKQHPSLRHFTLTVHRNGYMSYLPSDVLKYQRELRSVTITYADIREIPQFAFGNLTRLENITLIRSQIEVLDAYAFANHVSLQTLNLEENQIVQIDRLAFSSLPELTELVLTKNNISVLHDSMFESMSKLVRMRMAENLVADLTRNVFKGLGNLRILDLSFNNLKNVRDTVFAELWSLQELDLESNVIEKLSERAFDGLNNLRVLNLRNNKLQALEGGVFTGVPALTMLNLHANQLETITFDNMLPLMDNLVNNTHSTLDVSDNKFTCDCRLAWMFELRARTRNIDMRRTIESVICTMIRDAMPAYAHTTTLHDPTYQMPPPYEMTNTYPIITYDAFGNELTDQHHQQQVVRHTSQHFDTLGKLQTSPHHQPPAHHNQQQHQLQHHQQQVNIETYTATLMHIGMENLPCPRVQAAEPTELPLPRESIGLDLTWLTKGNSASAVAAPSVCLWTTTLVLVLSGVLSCRLNGGS